MSVRKSWTKSCQPIVIDYFLLIQCQYCSIVWIIFLMCKVPPVNKLFVLHKIKERAFLVDCIAVLFVECCLWKCHSVLLIAPLLIFSYLKLKKSRHISSKTSWTQGFISHNSNKQQKNQKFHVHKSIVKQKLQSKCKTFIYNFIFYSTSTCHDFQNGHLD